ncbi:MAG: bestrophin family ion channel [Bacteroidota bacterium]|nr:bestrophin family ion channel [Bacteroidota bacterium]
MAEKFRIDDIFNEKAKKWSLWFMVPFDFISSTNLRKISFAAFIVGVYTFVIDYLENYWLHVEFHPPSTIFYLLGLVLGLLLVFRTNTAYDRWWQGRIQISYLSNNAKNFASKMNAYLPKDDQDNRIFFAKMIANHAYAMKEVLRYGVRFDDLIETNKGELDKLKKVYHVPSEITAQIMIKLEEMYRSKKLSFPQYWELHKYIDEMTNIVGNCERIRTTPMPYSYRLHLKKFIFVFALMMPFGFIEYLDEWSVVIVVIIFYAMSGLDVIGEEIEDPFGQDEDDLPIDYVCHSIEKYATVALKVTLPSHHVGSH